ncbi:MAG: hypothetical protein HY741_07565 [Chloroflexi bacterium]|nr:hypothetical protein [Chloroflexota bacterium]
MLSAQALIEQAAILKKKRALLVEKIKQLALDEVKIAAGGQKFQIQQELADANQELGKLDQQLTDIDANRMYHALLEMDYFDQSISFDAYFAAQRIAAFLIHGPKDYGQDWLLRRLIALMPRDHEWEKIEIDLGSAVIAKEVSALWDDLASRVYSTPPFPTPAPAQIAQEAAKWLETKTVLLILRQIDAWEPTEAQALVTNFWQALAKAAQDTLKPGNTRLVMFLVDYRDLAQTWGLPLVDAPAPQVEPGIPIRLQEIKPFTPDVVKPWIHNHFVTYSDLLKPLLVNMEQTVQAIVDASQGGAPDQVAKAICFHCKHFYKKERWLTL